MAVCYVTVNITKKITVNNKIGTECLYGNSMTGGKLTINVHTQRGQFDFMYKVWLIFQEVISMVNGDSYMITCILC